MFYIIEKQDQLNQLKISSDECFINIIPYNDEYHPYLSKISLVYIRGLNSHKGYMLCIKHNESLSLNFDDVWKFIITKFKKIYVLNKKDFLHYTKYYIFGIDQKIYDLNLMKLIYENNIIEDKENYILISDFYNKFEHLEDINCLIPIGKHYEKQENIFKKIKLLSKYFNNLNKQYHFSNEQVTLSYYEIERKGICLDKNEFIKNFKHIKYPERNIFKGKIYTKYNLYTITGRPSNNFNGINFAALKKDNGERKTFIPENDKFIELDINAYHPRIIGLLINYVLPEEKLYETLGIEKHVMFENIYGGIKDEYSKIPFFKKIKEYVDLIWRSKEYEMSSGLRIFDYKKDNIDSPYKLLSWLIQSNETQLNTYIIQSIQSYLNQNNHKTKLIHTVYDSFLFDYAEIDGDIIEYIKKLIFFPTKMKTGFNYDVLK